MTVKVFVLTPSIIKVLSGKNLMKCCRECDRSFKIGDVIVSVQGTKRRWYCYFCAVKVQLI